MIILVISNCARFNALPTIHKPTFAFRSIVSNIDTAFYKFTRFVLHCLSHLAFTNVRTVKNFYEFVDKLKDISPYNCPNVPIGGRLECLERELHKFHCTGAEIEEILN